MISSGGDGRERLGELRTRLLALHTALLGCERRAYEERHGATTAAELLQLVLHHDEFRWLRAVSALITRIDEALDTPEPTEAIDTERYFSETRRLLRSGDSGPFATRYREALQQSPDIVLAHAEVVKLLPTSRPSSPAA